MSKFHVAILVGAGLIAWPALSNSLVSPGPQANIAKSSLSASPAGEWNKLSFRGGKNVEVWTIDGDALNKVTFYGGIEVGKPLLKELDKKNKPLPQVTANMLITDIPALLESSYRSQFSVNKMSIETQEPATISGHKGIRFTYTFVKNEEDVERKGEGIGAFVDNRLYLVCFEAPAIYFFDKDVSKFRQLASTLKL